MLEQLKQDVLEANLALPRHELVTFTWGNASGFDEESKLMVIKPSGVGYDELTADKMVVVNLDGRTVEGELRPSSDTPTHLELYRRFPGIAGIVHTHSPWATSWSQAGMDLPVFGTTHADYFNGAVPCTRPMTAAEISGDYELATGNVIAETFEANGISPLEVPAVFVHGHAPFTWGASPADAVYHAVVLEETAKMGSRTKALQPDVSGISPELLNKHFSRKHGSHAYYGQTGKEESR
ncbi:L-ribulose-5-phosphate 4-epimerase [Alkalicoccus luteus]|uniref:L-ribulose-5-phosphate 4-epimerase n=1 Tax=Alkalicoccus luteus TaxID=1237094 RepID=UPI004033A4B9